MILFTTWFATFLFEDGKVVSSKPFPKDVKEITKRLHAVGNNEVLSEEKQIIEGISNFLVLDPRLEKLGGDLIEEEMPDVNSADFGFSNDLLREAMLNMAKDKINEEVSGDESISQAVCTLDDLIQSANLLSERLHEWYGLHYPQQRRIMKEEDFVTLVLEKNIKSQKKEDDLKPVLNLATTLNDIYEQKSNLEEFIKEKMEKNAKNISILVGPIIGARLIAKAGSLDRLAKLPSGTIQVLGAEKALFRHLKDGSNPPKHGFLFQHPLVHRAPYWQRGKIARTFASKIAIAAKMDVHSDKMIGEDLKNEFLERIEEIKNKYPKPQKKGKKKR
jgi:nucleolar protein 56